MNGHKKTHNEFIKELELINPNIEVLGKYIGALKNIEVKCKIDNHMWFPTPANLLSVDSRGHSKGCPVCSNNTVMMGINDMWTTNPEQAKLLANPEDGYKYMQSGIARVNWKCPDCGHIIYNLRINEVNNHGLSCKKCSDGISFPERVLTNVLLFVENDFTTHKRFPWSENKIYDCYIEKYSMLIEMQGQQHTVKGFDSIGGRTVEEEKENDIYKEEMAKANEIKNYIVIDAVNSDFNLIKNNILQSDLKEFYNLTILDWDKIHINSLKSIVVLCANLWNSGKNINQIAYELKLSNSGVSKYLKRAKSINLCDYDSLKEKELSYGKMHEASSVSCICLNTLKEFNSISEASLFYSVDVSSISSCCLGKRKSAGRFGDEKLTWMYLDNYLSSDKDIIKNKINVSKYAGQRPLICLNTLEFFDSIKSASKWANIKSNSSFAKHLKGLSNYCGVFEDGAKMQWMFFDQYSENNNK